MGVLMEMYWSCFPAGENTVMPPGVKGLSPFVTSVATYRLPSSSKAIESGSPNCGIGARGMEPSSVAFEGMMVPG